MQSKFIYVFSTDARDQMLVANYRLLKSDDRQGVYVFENNNTQKFSKLEISYLLSDTLTF